MTLDRAVGHWDRRWVRRTLFGLAALLLAAGFSAGVVLRHHAAPAAAGTLPARPVAPAPDYGPRIATPPQALRVAHAFVRDAVLREHPGAAWRLVSPALRAPVSRRAWSAGRMPVQPFPARDFAGAGYTVLRSRAHDVLLDVTIASRRASPAGFEALMELRPRHGVDWRIVYFSVKGIAFPIPAAR